MINTIKQLFKKTYDTDIIIDDIMSNQKIPDNENFTNQGYCDDGNLIGNCRHCKANGVLVKFHKCDIGEW